MRRRRVVACLVLIAVVLGGGGVGACDAESVRTPTFDSVAVPDCSGAAKSVRGSFYDHSEAVVDRRDDGGDWNVVTPAEVGLDPEGLADAARFLRARTGVRSLLVIRRGKLAFEAYFGSSARSSRNVHSASKSILQALVGIAVSEGKIRSLDTPISVYLPQAAASGAGQVTVGQLLAMRSGLRWREDDSEDEIAESDDWVEAILDMGRDPAAGFNYSSGNTHVLSAVLQAATRMSTCEYARRKLFGPLQMMPERWGVDPRGVFAGGFNMFLTTRELGKFGQLYLDGGVWRGRQVVPAEAVRQSRTVPAEDADSKPDFTYTSGWWATVVGGHPMQVAWGYGGQYVCVVPDLGLVVVTTQDTSGPAQRVEAQQLDVRRFMERHVLPAVR